MLQIPGHTDTYCKKLACSTYNEETSSQQPTVNHFNKYLEGQLFPPKALPHSLTSSTASVDQLQQLGVYGLPGLL